MSSIGDEPESILQQCKLDAMGKYGTDLLQEEEHLKDVFECIAGSEGINAKLSLTQACDIVGCNTSTLNAFEEIFNLSDATGDGFITIGEFDSALAKYDSEFSVASASPEESPAGTPVEKSAALDVHMGVTTGVIAAVAMFNVL